LFKGAGCSDEAKINSFYLEEIQTIWLLSAKISSFWRNTFFGRN